MQVNTLRAPAFSTRSAVSQCEQHMLLVPVYNLGVKEYTFLTSLIPPPGSYQVSKSHWLPRGVRRERHSAWASAPEVCGSGLLYEAAWRHAQPFLWGLASLPSFLPSFLPRTLLGTGCPATPGLQASLLASGPSFSGPPRLSEPRNPLPSFTSSASLLCSPEILHFGN